MSSTEVLAPEQQPQPIKKSEQLDSVVIRFCGDSGDGMQLVGTQFTNVSAAFGNDVSTLPDFPAEIRAPVGTLAGVSGFQLHFSSTDIFTPGDEVDTLVAMNPAALKTNVGDLRRGGTLIVNDDEFNKAPTIAEANLRALRGGANYGFSTEAFTTHYQVPRARLAPGKYRKITGNEATAWGLVTAAKLAGKTLYYAGYPITPASDILHELSMMKNFGVRTFQAEDEIAAMAAVVGAAFTGQIAVTASSGPGICLKGEAMGLGFMTELPMIIVDVQRGGPSTGLPTKTEQSDLLLAMFGRNGDSPLPILAACSPGDCFTLVQEAVRIAVEFMTPVLFLTDGYIANGAEPWQIPRFADLKPIRVVHPQGRKAGQFATDGSGNGERE